MHRISLFSCIAMLFGVACGEQPGGKENSNGDSLPADSASDSSANHFLHKHDFGELIAEFEDPQRLAWQQPSLVIRKLGSLKGKTVADIGAGTGYFAFRLAESAEKVLAIDIDPRFLDHIRHKLDTLSNKENLNIETRLTAMDDPAIAPGEADLVLLVNTYHHIENREDYFKKVKSRLDENGVLAVVDFKKTELPVGPPPHLKLTPSEVRNELQSAGFREFEIDSVSLEYQFLIFCR